MRTPLWINELELLDVGVKKTNEFNGSIIL
jgi:hypothetical protein